MYFLFLKSLKTKRIIFFKVLLGPSKWILDDMSVSLNLVSRHFEEAICEIARIRNNRGFDLGQPIYSRMYALGFCRVGMRLLFILICEFFFLELDFAKINGILYTIPSI